MTPFTHTNNALLLQEIRKSLKKITIDLVLLWFPPQKKAGSHWKMTPQKKMRRSFADFSLKTFQLNLEGCQSWKVQLDPHSDLPNPSPIQWWLPQGVSPPERRKPLSSIWKSTYHWTVDLFCGRSVDSCKIIYTDPEKKALIWLPCLIFNDFPCPL